MNKPPTQKSSDTVRQKLIAQGICSGQHDVTIHALRYSTYRREVQWLPRTEIVEQQRPLPRIRVSNYTVKELAKADRLRVVENDGCQEIEPC